MAIPEETMKPKLVLVLLLSAALLGCDDKQAKFRVESRKLDQTMQRENDEGHMQLDLKRIEVAQLEGKRKDERKSRADLDLHYLWKQADGCEAFADITNGLDSPSADAMEAANAKVHAASSVAEAKPLFVALNCTPTDVPAWIRRPDWIRYCVFTGGCAAWKP
jgi:hypothetical protein